MSPTGGGGVPGPEQAYSLWLDSLARAGWDPEPAVEPVPVADALGRVSATAIVARWPSPRSDCAAMDGIATRAVTVRAAAGSGSGSGSAGPVVGGPSTGGPGAGGAGAGVRLPAGAFAWIDTGDPMPAGTDTVVLREWLLAQADGSVVIARGAAGAGPPAASAGDQGAGRARMDAAAAAAAALGSLATPGKHVRRAGEDFAAGEVLVPAGRRLRPGDLAAAAAAGHGSVTVTGRPVVAIIPTGDEIRPAGSALRRGDIADTNSVMLAARCQELGAWPAVSDVQPDDPDVLAAEIRRAALGAALVLVIAGSSRGRDDHTGAVLAQVGGVAVTGVAVRPGHPALLGHVKLSAADRGGIAPVIGLPGYPLATAVIFELFAVPLLAAAQGTDAGAGEPVRLRPLATLDRSWSSPPGVEEWVLVTLAHASKAAVAPRELPVATPARRGAGSISQLARADAWWRVPAGQVEFRAGTTIELIPLTPR